MKNNVHSLGAMEGVGTKAIDPSEDGVAKTTNSSTTKIALMPFVEVGRIVHVLDANGKSFPVR